MLNCFRCAERYVVLSAFSHPNRNQHAGDEKCEQKLSLVIVSGPHTGLGTIIVRVDGNTAKWVLVGSLALSQASGKTPKGRGGIVHGQQVNSLSLMESPSGQCPGAWRLGKKGGCAPHEISTIKVP